MQPSTVTTVPPWWQNFPKVVHGRSTCCTYCHLFNQKGRFLLASVCSRYRYRSSSITKLHDLQTSLFKVHRLRFLFTSPKSRGEPLLALQNSWQVMQHPAQITKQPFSLTKFSTYEVCVHCEPCMTSSFHFCEFHFCDCCSQN